MVDTPTTPPPSGPDAPRRGHPEHEPTDETRVRVKTLAGFMPAKLVAVHMDLDPKTLRKHYSRELLSGRAAIVASVGSSMIAKAMQPDGPGVDQRLKHDAQKFVLARLGDWTQKIGIEGADGDAPRQFDLSHLSLEDKHRLLGVLTQLREGEATGTELVPIQIPEPQSDVVDAEFTEVAGEEGAGGSGA
jgi:hypothetical protein